MLRQRIETTIEQLDTTTNGKVGVYAATIDGDESVDEGFENHDRLISEISLCVYDAWAARYE